MLARAFDDDPVARFVFGAERRLKWGLRRFFRVQLEHLYLPHEAVWTTEDLAGAALWAPPGTPRPDLVSLWHLAPVLPFTLSKRVVNVARLIGALDHLRPEEPHWYLATLGTDPPRQGHGFGSALMRPVLERCDEDGTPAYLESSKERNVPFYARHGFEVTKVLRLRGGAPPLWLMWREPKGESPGPY